MKYISSKYNLSGRQKQQWNPTDKSEFEQLQKQEQQLLSVQRRRSEVQSHRNACAERMSACWEACGPVRVVVGVLLLLTSILVVLSLTMSCVDKLKNSKCTTSCGYSVDKPSIPNPVDLMLNLFSKVFPVDLFVFGAMSLYIYLCAITGLVALGVGCCYFKMLQVKISRTTPGAMLLGSWVLMFVAVAVNMEILTLSPQYATFGNQFYMKSDNSTGVLSVSKETCTIEASSMNSTCVMSQVGKFVHTLNVELPFFGVIFFFANLVFLTTFVLFASYLLLCRRTPDAYKTVRDEAADDNFYADE